MAELVPKDFPELYAGFKAPIAALDCGERCAPYNERGVPFCCDAHQAVPTAYQAEWEYLRENTDLWHLWEPQNRVERETIRLAPEGHVLIACLGHTLCQRNYRSLTCRAFPFFPYVTREGRFLGLSYYWEYEDRCWVISNLNVMTQEYFREFIELYDKLFARLPEELENFRQFSGMMRRVFGRSHRAIPLLHRNGQVYKITPRNGRMRRSAVEKLPKFGPYQIAARLPFPEESSGS
jgi:hypothetical protein